MNTAHFGVLRAPHEVIFGAGQRRAIGRVAARIGKRALICTDARFGAAAEMREILAELSAAGVAAQVFDGTLAELPAECILDCLEISRAFDAQMLVGVGGGSCVDLAKLVSLLLTHGGELHDYYGELKVPGPVLPVIAVPTTSGTGSEMTPVAVLGDRGRDLKVGISSPYLIPHTAICDPELTLTCPPGLTALSGADALTHAIEAFTAVRHPVTPELSQGRVFVGKNMLSDQQALSAIRALARYLPRAVEQGDDLEARSMVMYGAAAAGLAFGVAGTAAAHAIQYPVGALTGTAHGLGVAALLPYVMEFNAPACRAELAQIAQAIGLPPMADEVSAGEAAIARVRELCNGIGIPRRLAELGVTEDKLDWIAEQSLLSARLVDNNPRKLDKAAMTLIVENAFHGRSALFAG
ncbi:Alcohol dehydrogenase 2 [Pigmentiphaga humi]|uniref:Alcohol dehydrogenase 2 n=1 Tax=Pigmentiphaga humi TaxID=2478468 RepID=A0A3P4B102_9BURK|nr:iron-containing alcohol dehydrogenase [Pigmentiphaga humi]VCU69410.1 Alcohol dehydrogenase 2 [Pigmentiphaga humi]